MDVRGCWGSDFSHFYRGVQIVSDPLRSKSWVQLQNRLKSYDLNDANAALADVSAGNIFKALISIAQIQA